MIYKDKVYDMPKYADDHPGGADLVTEWAGKYCTKAFQDAGHSFLAVIVLKRYKIGYLATSLSEETSRANVKESTKEEGKKNRICILRFSAEVGIKVTLQLKEWKQLKRTNKILGVR